MAFRRRYAKRRFSSKRRYVRRTGTRRVARVARRVVRNMAETKFFTEQIANPGITTVPVTFSWADTLAQGITQNTRVGNQIRVQALSFKLWFDIGDNIGNGYSIVRILVLYPRKGLSEPALLAEATLQSITTRPNPSRVFVLYDKQFVIGNINNAANVNAPPVRLMKFAKRCRYVFNYDPNAAVTREPILVVLSNTAAGAANQVSCVGYKSMSFKDL